MITDANTIDTGTRLNADVCVIGAGPAGITVARTAARRGLTVVLLEAGGDPYDRADRRMWPHAFVDHLRGDQALTRGRSDGEPYFPLRLSRARGFGGSTNALKDHGLRARPLDALDFEPRLGISWPFAYEELDQFLPSAMDWCGLDGTRHPDVWNTPSLLDGDEDVRKVTILDGPRDAFTTRAFEDAARSEWLCLTHAVAVSLVTQSNHFDSVVVRTRKGNEFTVSADRCVVATGGIDNARLLLASPDVLSQMGDSAGNVGRYFMEHPHYAAGYLLPSSPDASAYLSSAIESPSQEETHLSLSYDLIREHDLLRATFELAPIYREAADPGVRAFGSLARAVPFGPYTGAARWHQASSALRSSRAVLATAQAHRSPDRSKDAFALLTMSEQPPIADSRITLSSRRDSAGMPLPILHWKVDESEFSSMRQTLSLLGKTMESQGVGEVRSVWDQGLSRPPVINGGWHHMGTTRMSDDPASGVVDRNCDVHGVEGLSIAGSSVFPTGGFANPTLTLIALALRLAEHVTQS